MRLVLKRSAPRPRTGRRSRQRPLDLANHPASQPACPVAPQPVELALLRRLPALDGNMELLSRIKYTGERITVRSLNAIDWQRSALKVKV